MPEVKLNGPWQAYKHGHPASSRSYLMNAKHHIIASGIEHGLARAIATFPDVVAERDELRELLIEAQTSLAFVRSWSTQPPLRDDAPASNLRQDFWTWAEGWDCNLELRIGKALAEGGAEAKPASPAGAALPSSQEPSHNAALGEVTNETTNEGGDRRLPAH